MNDINLNYFHEHKSSGISYSLKCGDANLGKKVAVFGAIHGDEYKGVEAMVSLHQYLMRNQISLAGEVSFIIGNPEAYKNGLRYLDNDLNREFLRQTTNTNESRRAEEIRELLVQERFDGVLDLHSLSQDNLKILVYPIEEPGNFALASAVSPIKLHFSYHKDHIQGAMISEASENGSQTFAVECGNHNSSSALDLATYHINNFLVYFDITDIEHLPRSLLQLDGKPIKNYESLSVIPGGSDFKWKISDIRTETFLKKGEVFAQDDFGERLAPLDCYVMMPSKTTRSNDQDVGFLAMKKK